MADESFLEQPEKSAEELKSSLEDSIGNLITTIAQFPKEHRLDKLFSDWSLKDILAHFSGWNILTMNDLKRLMNGENINSWPFETEEEIDAFNAVQVEIVRDHMNWEETYAEFVESCELLVNAYSQLTNEQWDLQFGPEDSTPRRSIEIDIKHFREDHLPEIRNVISSLQLSSNEEL